MKHRRNLFTDGWNSTWHATFGILSKHFPVIIPTFIIYQFIDYKDVNLFIDLSEYFIGFLVCYLFFMYYPSMWSHSVSHSLF